jgi:hypothetical protein
MDHILENKFLNKEAAYKTAFNEQDTVLQAVDDADDIGGVEAMEYQIYESFVKEKGALLNYIYDIIRFVSKKQGFEANQFLPEGTANIESQIKDDQDLFNIKNRIIVIVSIIHNQCPGYFNI